MPNKGLHKDVKLFAALRVFPPVSPSLGNQGIAIELSRARQQRIKFKSGRVG